MSRITSSEYQAGYAAGYRDGHKECAEEHTEMTRIDDLSELKRLAEAAKRLWPDNEWYVSERGRIADLDPEDGDYIAAASPSAILSLIARVEGLEEALRPFANMLPAFVDFLPPGAEDCEYEINGTIFRLVDIRAAARALKR